MRNNDDVLKATLGSVSEGLLTAQEGFEALQQFSRSKACTPELKTIVIPVFNLMDVDYNKWGLLVRVKIIEDNQDTYTCKYNVKSIVSLDATTIEITYWP
jgi:hypothetical protein